MGDHTLGSQQGRVRFCSHVLAVGSVDSTPLCDSWVTWPVPDALTPVSAGLSAGTCKHEFCLLAGTQEWKWSLGLGHSPLCGLHSAKPGSARLAHKHVRHCSQEPGGFREPGPHMGRSHPVGQGHFKGQFKSHHFQGFLQLLNESQLPAAQHPGLFSQPYLQGLRLLCLQAPAGPW